MKKSNKKDKLQSTGGKTYKEKAITLRNQRLKAVVKAYQRGNKGAAELLRQSFFPLIYKLAHKESVYSLFHEEAENEVWLIFYTLVKKYQGENFRNFPANIKQLMELKLIDATTSRSTKSKQETSGGEDLEKLNLEAPDALEPVLTNVAISNAIENLSKEQQEVIKYIYFTDLKQEAIAKELGYSTRQLRRFKNLAITSLRQNLNK